MFSVRPVAGLPRGHGRRAPSSFLGSPKQVEINSTLEQACLPERGPAVRESPLEQEAKTLVEQFLTDPDSESQPDKLEDVLRQLPAEKCRYERGILTFLNGRVDEAIEHLHEAAVEKCRGRNTPIACGDLYDRWVSPFGQDPQPTLWSRLADAFADKWSGSAAHLLLQAYAALDDDDTETAEELCAKCLNVDEQYWLAASLLGTICESRREWDKACEYYEQALEHATGEYKTELHLLLGYVQLELQNTDAAEDSFKKALDCRSDYWEAALELAMLYEDREELEKAYDFRERALHHAEGRDKAHVYCALANDKLRRKETDAAVDFCEKALECDEQSWKALACLGDIHGDKKEWRKALEYYERAISCADDYGKARTHFAIGDCKWNLEDLDGAVDSFAAALEAEPTYWYAELNLGCIYGDRKNWRAAKACYEQAWTHAVADPTASTERKAGIHFELAQCCSRVKDHEATQAAYRTCLELVPDFPYARNNLGWSLVRSGKYEEAVEVFEESLRRGNDGKYPLRNLARALRKLKRYAEAIEILQQDTRGGSLTKSAKKEIEELKALLEKQEQGEAITTEDDDDLEELEADSVSSEDEACATDDPAAIPKGPSRSRTTKQPLKENAAQIHKEDELEGLIESRIDREQEMFGRRLRMFQANDSRYGRYGRQFPIPGIGLIDLLTVDVSSGDLVVIELKRDKPTRDIVGQLREYMGWAEKYLATDDQQVNGIICVWEATERLSLAVRGLPNVEVFEYALTCARIEV